MKIAEGRVRFVCLFLVSMYLLSGCVSNAILDNTRSIKVGEFEISDIPKKSITLNSRDIDKDYDIQNITLKLSGAGIVRVSDSVYGEISTFYADAILTTDYKNKCQHLKILKDKFVAKFSSLEVEAAKIGEVALYTSSKMQNELFADSDLEFGCAIDSGSLSFYSNVGDLSLSYSRLFGAKKKET